MDPLRLLLIEDLPTDAELILRALRKGGLEVIEQRVENEPALLSALAAQAPDIVLSDYNLPGFDGEAALQHVRERHPLLPFLFVSDAIGEDRAIELMRRGATDFVLKSNLSRLPPAVRRALAEAASAAARVLAEQRLRANEQRLRDIVETSRDWIWELDADGRFTFSNGAVQRILGHDPATLPGVHFAELLHPEDRWRWASLLPALAPSSEIHGQNIRWLHRDGSHRWLERHALARVHDGVLQGYRGTDRDVTLRLQHETHIVRLNRIHGLLSSVNAVVAKAASRAQLLQEICRLAVERGGYLRVIIASPGQSTGSGLRPLAWDSSMPHPIDSLSLPLAQGPQPDVALPTRALQTGQPAICDDLAGVSARELPQAAALRALGVQGVACLPLLADERPLGLISFESADAGAFDAEELALLQDIATDVAFGLQYFEKDEAVQFLSRFDSLTHLAKRELFCDRLGARLVGLPSRTPAAVLVLDLERMGYLNDTLGRDFGDQLLRAAAGRLQARVGDTNRLAHLGSGAFAISLIGSAAVDPGLSATRENLRQLFDAPFSVGGREVVLTLRTGTALYPKDGATPVLLLDNAEAAVRRAKEVGEADYSYTVAINTQLAQRMQLSQRLLRALELQQFELHYQPIVDLQTRSPVAAEALLRWRDPTRGLVSPAEFIPMLEQTGQIVQVGQWVLRQAARDVQRLREAGLPRLQVAVNISPLQLYEADFVPRLVEQAIDPQTGESRLSVEITESLLMQDVEECIAKLQALRSAGIRTSIDDFGTGYSSLSLLTRLPVDRLKIDKSFVQALSTDAAAMTLASTVINLGRSFKLQTVAEGVETEEQLNLLRLVKCDFGQGYLFSKPLPFADLLRRYGEGAT